MRPITSHSINPANDGLSVTAVDGPGPGGANHHYVVTWGGAGVLQWGKRAYAGYVAKSGGKSLVSGAVLPPWEKLPPEMHAAWIAAALAAVQTPESVSLKFQNGPVNEKGVGVNGITHEVLLGVVIDRLEAFQAGKYASPHNAAALDCLRKGLEHLHDRTRERMQRGVEGTHQV